MFGNEIEILKYLESLRTDFLANLFEFITILGEETILILLIAVLYFAFNKNFAQKLFYICVTSLGVNGIIKNFVKLPRPFLGGKITPVRADTATGYSFPSGHTQNFATWSTVLSLNVKKIWCGILTGAFIILIAFSRIFLGVHYLSDVIVGAILGVLLAIIGNIIFDKIKNKKTLFLITIFILTPFALIFLIKPDAHFQDFFKIYGMLIGFVFAVIFEEKFAPIEYNVAVWKKTVRVVIGIVVAYTIKEVIKMISIFSNLQILLIMDTIRYMILVFTVLGICPLIFKKCKL